MFLEHELNVTIHRSSVRRGSDQDRGAGQVQRRGAGRDRGRLEEARPVAHGSKPLGIVSLAPRVSKAKPVMDL